MATRILTSAIGLPILVALIIYGGSALQFAAYLMSAIGMLEIYKALSHKHRPIHFVGYVFAFLYYLTLANLNSTYLLIACSSFIIATLIFIVFQYNEDYSKVNIIDCAITVFGFFYVAVLLSFVYMVREHNYGQFFVWLIFICAWGCDTGAYFVGVAFGKHKLAPKLSPKKTIEGSIGGTVFATLIAFVYSYSMVKFFNMTQSIVVPCVIVGAIGSIFAQFGDLAASAIKRYTKIKDFGKLIPGHGGVIDRFDSILFTAPGVFIVMVFLETAGYL